MPNAYLSMSLPELDDTIADLEAETERLRSLHLSLDMARGKPSPEQVALSRPMLDVLDSTSDLSDEGVDSCNYGCPDGLPSARRLMASILGVDAENLVVSGASSLSIMFDVVCHAWTHGVCGNTPWCEQGPVRFLCPSPGYDRHFAITEHFGIENVPVRMTDVGPDMDEVRRLVETDATVKGMWCVPKYQNPTGVTFSDDVVRQIASLRPAAPDFRIFWDNAYVVHDLIQPGDQLLEVFGALAEAGAPDMVYEFASTSKVTFPGSGIACVCASAADMADLRAAFSIQRVCPDKLTQLMHVRYLHDADGVRAHMVEQASVLRPRFELVERKLSEGLGSVGCAMWTHPRGGYFVSFDGPEGSAKAIVSLMAELGVKLTAAGATWPGGDDPRDTNIRLAPSFPDLADLGSALDVFVVCVRLVSARLAREARQG
jgi:aspartate/methionine/tyrosine aminotransferase